MWICAESRTAYFWSNTLSRRQLEIITSHKGALSHEKCCSAPGSRDQPCLAGMHLMHLCGFSNSFPVSPVDPSGEGGYVYSSRALFISCIILQVFPIILYRHYFGEKVGIYFTWVGFYTAWLLPASIVGMIVMFYGFSTIPLSRNPPAWVLVFLSSHLGNLCRIFPVWFT